MKKILFLIVILGVITKWDIVSGYFNLTGFDNKYSVGEYSSEKWYYDYRGYEEALRISDENEVPIFIYVYADWCKYCNKFKKELLTENSVKSSLSQFVKVRINPEHSKIDKALYNKWGGRGYPGLLFQSGSGNKPKRVRGPFFKNNNKWKMMTAEEFTSMLNKNGA